SEGFKMGFISAGLSYAANEIAGAIEETSSGGSGKAKGEVTTTSPLNKIPDASTMPIDQRKAYVLYGISAPYENQLINVNGVTTKNIPFPGAVAGEATAVLTEKGYNVEAIQITSTSQLETLSSSGLLKGSIVVVAAHNSEIQGFYWGEGYERTLNPVMANIMGNSGASNVFYLSCQSNWVAKQTNIIGGMHTWGAKGLLTIGHGPVYYGNIGQPPQLGWEIVSWSKGVYR
ncbi:MAG: hypothetical protein ACE14Q_08755, partial [Acidobacteriota bacterium]